MLARFPRAGRVDWIGVSAKRKAPITVVDEVFARVGTGLDGDHHCSQPRRWGNHSDASAGPKRQVTLIQAEYLPVIASLSAPGPDGLPQAVTPERLRRNILVSGLSLLCLKGRTFRLGEALLEYSGECPPCSRMEEEFGEGGYNAVRGHGGITARVLEDGWVRLGDRLVAV